MWNGAWFDRGMRLLRGALWVYAGVALTLAVAVLVAPNRVTACGGLPALDPFYSALTAALLASWGALLLSLSYAPLGYRKPLRAAIAGNLLIGLVFLYSAVPGGCRQAVGIALGGLALAQSLGFRLTKP